MAVLALLWLLSAARAATPTSGVTTFNSVPTQTVVASSSAASPGITASNVSGWDFNAISPGSILASVDVRDGAVGSSNGVAIRRSDGSTADFNAVKVTANDQSTFDLRSVGLNVEIVQGTTPVAGRSVVLTGLNSVGNPIAGATFTATVNDAQLVTFDVSANVSFTGVSAFSVVPLTTGDSLGYVFLDDLQAINFAALDNVAPGAPSVPRLAAGSDSGTSGSDNLTNVNPPTFTGTAEAGSTVRLYDTDGITVLGSGPAAGGNWSILSSNLSQGNHTVTARAIDAAGNVSAASPGLTITIDVVAPLVSSVVLPANGNYGAGEYLDFTVTYSKGLTVTTSGGTPYISVSLDTGGFVRAYFLFGSGTSVLTFRYTVVNGNYDSNGITAGSSVTLNGGTLRDTAGNNATLILTGIGSTTGIRVDATPPTVASINRVQTSPTNNASLGYTVTFSKPVTGVDVSDFVLTTTGAVAALNLNITPVTTSTYTVTISAVTGEGTMRLDLKSSGTGIADLAGNGMTSGYTAGQPYTVDRMSPVVNSVGVPANGTYLGTQNLTVTVTFSEAVTVVTSGGTPRLPITLDSGGTVNAAYLSGSGSSTLTFRYTVVSGNADPDGISIGAAIQANGGIIRDAVGNDATLTLRNVASTAGVFVDAVLPVITSVTLPLNGTYTAGQNLDFTVNFSEAVTVNAAGGIPSLGVTFETGGAARATYISGTGTTALAFRYPVVAGNSDVNGIAVGSAISLNSATLRDASGNNATLTLGSIGLTTGILVDAIAPTVISINRQAPASASTNLAAVTFRATFSEAVSGVDPADFILTTTSTVLANISAINAVSGAIYDVTVDSISGTGTLRLDLKTTGTGIADAAGNALATGAIGSQLYTIDTVAPTVVSVTAPAPGTYKVGDPLNFSVTFSESVAATSSVRLPITLDTGGIVNANYVSGTGTTGLVFRYIVAAGTLDPDGITIGSALQLNGGSVSDSAGNSATLTLNNVADPTGVFVDGVAPTVLSVNVPPGATYKLGSQLDLTVAFSKNVTVAGLPRLAVTLDAGGAANATYLSGSGTNSLTFRYTVTAGHSDKTGLVLASAIALNSGTLRDAAGNNAVLALNNVNATNAVLVDGIVPTVASIARVGSANSTAAALEYTVTFGENVTGVAPAAFILTTTGTVNATIASLTATSGTVYKVMLDPVTGDGTLRLDLAANGTGIADLAGNAIASGFTTGDLYTLDHSAPAVTSVTVPANAIYISGQKLDFTVRLSEAANVATTGGIPYLPVTLDTGGAIRADYVSGSGTTALLFRFTVVAGHVDPDGITLGGSIAASGATLRDAAGNDLILTLNGVPSTAGVLIDAVAPAVLSVSAPANGTYAKDAGLNFTVTYSEIVNVVTTGGTPILAITLAAGGPAEAAYVSGSSSSTLIFRYIVAAGQQDTDGIAVASSLTLKGGTIRDAASNAAALTLPAFPTTGVLVDGLEPAVSSIARMVPTTATTSQSSVKFRVTFNKEVAGVDAGDFALTATGSAAGTIGAVTTVNGQSYEVTVSSLASGGTLRLDLTANSGIADAVGNPLTGAFTGGETYQLVNNDAPSFTPGPDIAIGADGGPQIVAEWATDITPGAPAESAQLLRFTVTVDRPSLFTVAPAIAPNGTLTFTPNPTASGTATATVILHDDADANSTSDPATFQIALTSYDGALGTYHGLVQAAPGTAVGNEKTGVLRVVVGKKGAFTGSLKLAGSPHALRGSFDKSGAATFGKTAATSFELKRKNLPPLTLALQLAVSEGTDTLSATLQESGADFAVIAADRALYTSKPNPPPPYMNVPAALLGRYTVVFAAKSPAAQARSASEYPQGDGIGVLRVNAQGVAVLSGTLADGTPVSCSSALSKTNGWPFYASFAARQGSISGPVLFRERAAVSDFDALDVQWFQPENSNARHYPDGWPDGIRADLLGSKFVIKRVEAQVNPFTGAPMNNGQSDAAVVFTDGNLADPGLRRTIRISTRTVVSVIDRGAEKLAVHLLLPYGPLGGQADGGNLAATGRFGGSFIHPVSQARTRFQGVIFQKQQAAFGFFLGIDEAGSVTLTPQP